MLSTCVLIATMLTRLNDLAAAVEKDSVNCCPDFCITGTVTYVIGFHERLWHVLLEEDDSGVDFIGQIDSMPPNPGDLVRLSGKIVPYGAASTKPWFQSLEHLGKRTLTPPMEAPAVEIMNGQHDFHRAHLIGEIRDVQPSGSDPCWNYISVIDTGNLYYVPVPTRGADLKQLETLIGATVRIEGFPDPHNCSYRFLDERRFMLSGMNHIKVIASPRDNPFDNTPSVDELRRLPLERIARLGRHKATGRVLTVWQRHNALLKLRDDRMAVISFASSEFPSRGQNLEVIGYPSTDGFLLRLSRAISHPIADTSFSEPKADALSSKDIENWLSKSFLDKRQLQGMRIQLCGTVAEFNASLRERRHFPLMIAGHLLEVDFSSLAEDAKDLVAGCHVQVTGTCVLSTENWSAISTGLQLDGIRLVLDRKGDIVILRHPPWWTATRLSVVVIILLLFLAGCLTWNRLLHRLSEKRGRELFKERSSNAFAELKAEERTRLSVELHDSISQILTGAAMQLDAGEIGAAKRILASCRRELRRCLWDLRSNAIDAANFGDAVRETLAPHLGGTEIKVDLDIPSASISEELRHAALRIIREATVNAIRHGHATLIAICGEFNEKTLSFTVIDDGRGFDPSVIQGAATGHFGLVGMRERAKSFNGILNILSAPGSGTEVSVALEERTNYDFDEEPADRNSSQK